LADTESNPLEIQPERLKNLLKELVNIYSPSGKEEEVLEYTEQYLKNQGLPVIREQVDENRYNLLVLPEDENIDLCFVGHLDTVAAYDLDDFGFSEDEGKIYGLGTADMKAGCAAMIEAFTTLQANSKIFRRSAWRWSSGKKKITAAPRHWRGSTAFRGHWSGAD